MFCKGSKILDPPHCGAGDDEKRVFSTFYERINIERKFCNISLPNPVDPVILSKCFKSFLEGRQNGFYCLP